MIILRLRGGLGNQLFQFAAGSALAQRHGVELKLDLYYYKKHPFRTFDLPNFNIDFKEAAREEVHRFTGANPIRRFLNKYENYFHCPKVCAQPHYHFYEDFFELPSDIYLTGYWQSEKYFLNIQDQVRSWYSVKGPLDQKTIALIADMKASNSVSLHVRRGDYSGNSIFGFVPLDYYRIAIDQIQRELGDAKFFVFSDDVGWCKQNLSVPSAIFVEHNVGKNSFRDMVLMSNCKHNIIANSTFSWWGAWLNSNSAKKVFAPKVWFQKAYNENPAGVYPARYYNTKDLIPAEWMRL